MLYIAAHTGERVKCTFCNKDFLYDASLKRHIERMHPPPGEKPKPNWKQKLSSKHGLQPQQGAVQYATGGMTAEAVPTSLYSKGSPHPGVVSHESPESKIKQEHSEGKGSDDSHQTHNISGKHNDGMLQTVSDHSKRSESKPNVKQEPSEDFDELKDTSSLGFTDSEGFGNLSTNVKVESMEQCENEQPDPDNATYNNTMHQLNDTTVDFTDTHSAEDLQPDWKGMNMAYSHFKKAQLGAPSIPHVGRDNGHVTLTLIGCTKRL